MLHPFIPRLYPLLLAGDIPGLDRSLHPYHGNALIHFLVELRDLEL